MVKSIKRDDLLRNFCKKEKGFQMEQGSREITLYFAYKGKATAYRTHCSRGAKGKTLTPFHIKAMAQQLNLTEEEFSGFDDCTLVKEDFIRIQKEKRGPDPLDLL